MILVFLLLVLFLLWCLVMLCLKKKYAVYDCGIITGCGDSSRIVRIYDLCVEIALLNGLLFISRLHLKGITLKMITQTTFLMRKIPELTTLFDMLLLKKRGKTRKECLMLNHMSHALGIIKI